MKEFNDSDVIRSSLVTYPRFEFKIYKNKIYSKNFEEDNLVLYDIKTENDVAIDSNSTDFSSNNNNPIL